MQKKVFIGCGAGFSGDRFDASIPIVKELKHKNEPKYLMFEVLAERTLAIAQQYRIKNPEEGYSPFLDSYITPIIDDCLQNNIKIISNIGAANPLGAAKRILQIAKEIKLKRTVYASSVAALAMPPKGPWKETLYGAYKLANEHTAYVYWADWDVPSIGIRPNIVYGLARDQGMSSKNTLAIQAAVLNKEYEIPFNGKYSWLYVGEAASAFISAISEDMSDAKVFNLNGSCETIEYGVYLLKQLKPNAKVRYIDKPFPFPPDLDDSPLRTYVGNYPSITVKEGVENTFKAFDILKSKGLCPPLSL